MSARLTHALNDGQAEIALTGAGDQPDGMPLSQLLHCNVGTVAAVVVDDQYFAGTASRLHGRYNSADQRSEVGRLAVGGNYDRDETRVVQTPVPHTGFGAVLRDDCEASHNDI